jgi:hypothetical protein
MSIFFQLPADLRERWWAAITLDEREAVEAEFHASQKPEKLTLNQMVADYVASDWCDRKESVFVLFVKDCYTQEERTQVMEGLMECCCCSRHKHKDVRHKPEGVCETKEKLCKCNCRHYARLFKRNELA